MSLRRDPVWSICEGLVEGCVSWLTIRISRHLPLFGKYDGPINQYDYMPRLSYYLSVTGCRSPHGAILLVLSMLFPPKGERGWSAPAKKRNHKKDSGESGITCYRLLRTLTSASVHQDRRQASLKTQPRCFVTDIA
jgi:hypothetical protein